MPGRLVEFLEVSAGNYNKIHPLITDESRFTEDGKLFIMEVKGHMDEDHINGFMNFLLIFGNVAITTDK